MVPWLQVDEPMDGLDAAQPMTSACFQMLRKFALTDWTSNTDSLVGNMVDFVTTLPVNWSECQHVIEAHIHYYHDEEAGSTTPPMQSTLVLDGWEQHIDDMHFVPATPSPAAVPKMYYVLHLFSGAKRPGDLHSAVAAMPTLPGGILCPISIDIIFDEKTCNLMQKSVQDFWLAQSARGLIHMVVCGPPCETWSVSRFRFLTEQTGPRPIRSCEDDETMWGLRQLKLKEIRQLRIGNVLLQFCLLLAASQAGARKSAFLERPAPSEERCGHLPPSIWRLQIMRLLLRHPSCITIPILQGLYGGLSPKPTWLLLVCEANLHSTIKGIMETSRNRIVLPKAIQMGRATTHEGYNTAPLKRYPAALCRALARAAFVCGKHAIQCSGNDDDPVHKVAMDLEQLYQVIQEGSDGADYHDVLGTR